MKIRTQAEQCYYSRDTIKAVLRTLRGLLEKHDLDEHSVTVATSGRTLHITADSAIELAEGELYTILPRD